MNDTPNPHTPDAIDPAPAIEPPDTPPEAEEVVPPDAADQDGETKPKGSILSPYVKDGDLELVVWVAAGAVAVMLVFGLFIWLSGLVKFPDFSAGHSDDEHFANALIHRERRLALAMLSRTFLTGFAFVVGLALSAMGGIFILRQVTAFTAIGVNSPSASQNVVQHDQNADADQKSITKPARLFSLESYSPGVIFLAGGVFIMAATQFFTQPISSVEIVHPKSTSWCLRNKTDENGRIIGREYQLCGVRVGEQVSSPLQPAPAENAECQKDPNLFHCKK